MNAISSTQLHSSFALGILALLDRVEYRRIHTPEEFEDIGKLRQNAYNSKEFINSGEFGAFVDEYDYTPDCHTIGVYIDERLASTIRLHISSQAHLHGPTASYFPERAQWLVKNGGCYIDPSRFAADHTMLWDFPAIPFLTLRLAAVASEYFNADYCMSFVRSDIASFYTRSFGAIDMEPPQHVPGFTVPMMLLGARIEDIRERIETRYPFFQSTELERRMLFAQEDKLSFPPLSIHASARHVMSAKMANSQLRSLKSVIATAV